MSKVFTPGELERMARLGQLGILTGDKVLTDLGKVHVQRAADIGEQQAVLGEKQAHRQILDRYYGSQESRWAREPQERDADRQLQRELAQMGLEKKQQTGGVRLPLGFEWDPETEGAMRAITGGPHDPERPQAGGAREAIFMNRVLGSAAATTEDLKNIMHLPSGASLGYLGTGIGANPGVSMMDAMAGNLKHRVASDEVKAYNTMLGGLNRAMGLMEGQGLATSDAFTATYDTLQLRPTDTVADKMMKLAQMKQTAVAAMRPHLNSPRVSEQQKELIRTLTSELEQAVPFDVRDVIDVQHGRVTSLSDAISKRYGFRAEPENETGGFTILGVEE